MAPSIAELPTRTEPSPVTVSVPVKTISGAPPTQGEAEVKPRIRRIIEEEGENTTASVCHGILRINELALIALFVVPELLADLGPRRKIRSPGTVHSR
jgi:hypothetical protein